MSLAKLPSIATRCVAAEYRIAVDLKTKKCDRSGGPLPLFLQGDLQCNLQSESIQKIQPHNALTRRARQGRRFLNGGASTISVPSAKPGFSCPAAPISTRSS